jgi:hypothetical protein
MQCWQDLMAGKSGLSGRPKQMTACMGKRLHSGALDLEYFVEDHRMPAGSAAGKQQSSAHSGDTLIGTHAEILAYNRELYKAGHKEAVSAVSRLQRQARQAADEPDEVITSKTMVPPTGDKRTYMSLATYCWPSNPEELDNPKGPWTCTDGKAFPGVRPCLLDHVAPCSMLVNFDFGAEGVH